MDEDGREQEAAGRAGHEPRDHEQAGLPEDHGPHLAQKKELETYLREGTYGEFLYKNVAILDVGWDPWYSPFHQDFNPYGIHRITASEMGVEDVGLYDWIKYFDEHPEERFISDGNPEILTIPSSKKDIIQVPEGMKLYAYEEKE